MKTRKDTKLWQYLVEKGVLDKGEEAIKQAKSEYRTTYHRVKKREHRKLVQEHTIGLRPFEQNIIEREAKRHHMTEAKFIIDAAIAYTQQKYLIPEKHLLHQVYQLILRTNTEVAVIRARESIRWLKPNTKIEELQAILVAVHRKIDEIFGSPLTIEEVIKEQIDKDPSYLFYITFRRRL